MAEISWTEEAQRWLNDIFEYIAADNPEAAARTVEGIKDDGNIDILGVFHGALDITRYQLYETGRPPNAAMKRTGFARRSSPERWAAGITR